jgi:cytochrome b involved in lipid metabolism
MLEGAVAKAAAPPPRDMVAVTTARDGEHFPVKAKLLRPCLALTSAVQAGRGVHATADAAATVDVDCCTFDRVLLFLEAAAHGRSFDILPEHLDGMSAAADTLKLQGLRDLCDRKLGAFESRVRREPIALDEVHDRNARGDTLLAMDGMVFDVTRWLPEHPGGSSIIPAQALGRDCTVFFEIYHVSRQSFLYLKEFYIGELRDEDKVRLPRGDGSPSPGFLEQLRVQTSWRLDFSAAPNVHKSF